VGNKHAKPRLSLVRFFWDFPDATPAVVTTGTPHLNKLSEVMAGNKKI